MTLRTAARLAWSVWALCVVLAVGSLVLSVSNWNSQGTSNDLFSVTFGVLLLAYPTVGALIASRYPGNAIGWMFCGLGTAMSMWTFTTSYGQHGIVSDPGSLPAAPVIASISEWVLTPALVLAASTLLLLFPDGRPFSRRWLPLAWLTASLTGLLTILLAITPGPLYDFNSVQNALGVERARGFVGEVTTPAWLVTMACCIAAPISLLMRYRRSRGEERLQLKWIAFAGGLFVPVLVSALFGVPGAWIGVLLGVAAVPIATGFAILRYRLYEIDRIISRTLVYGSLTAVLAAIYAGLVLGGQAVFSSFAGGSNLAVAMSTLIVAALFLPARSRVQRFVDRRFYRRRYDARRTLEVFGARLRDHVDLETLSTELRRVVLDTMQPAHVGLWLRKDVGGR